MSRAPSGPSQSCPCAPSASPSSPSAGPGGSPQLMTACQSVSEIEMLVNKNLFMVTRYQSYEKLRSEWNILQDTS